MGGVLARWWGSGALGPPSISPPALFGAVPLVAAIALLMLFGVETRRKGLEAITAEELARRVVEVA